MSENKTRETGDDVTRFLEKIKDETTREDCLRISRMMQEASGHEPRMWGSSTRRTESPA